MLDLSSADPALVTAAAVCIILADIIAIGGVVIYLVHAWRELREARAEAVPAPQRDSKPDLDVTEQRRRQLLADGPWRHHQRRPVAPTRLDIRCLDLRDLSRRALRSPSGNHSLVQARMVARRPPMARGTAVWTAILPEVT